MCKMTMAVHEEIERVEKLLEEEKFRETLTKIEHLEKRTDLSHDNQIQVLLLKSTVFMKLGEYEQSNEILGEFLGKKNITPTQAVDALMIKVENLFRQGEFNEGLEIANECEQSLLQLSTQIGQKELLKRQTNLLRRK